MSASWSDPTADFDLWAREISPVYDWQADDGSGLTVDDETPGLLLRGLLFAGMFQLGAIAAVAGAVFAGFSVVRWLVGA